MITAEKIRAAQARVEAEAPPITEHRALQVVKVLTTKPTKPRARRFIWIG